MTTVGAVLLEQASRTPAASLAVFAEGQGCTEIDYAGGVELARYGAAVLTDLGVRRGDAFAVVLGNCREFVACLFGAAWTGAVMVPCNPDSTATELQHMFSHSGSVAAITDAARLSRVREAFGAGPVALTGDDFDLRAQQAAPSISASGTVVGSSDPLAVLYTSGTTSLPKGVLVTHANFLHAGEVVAQNLRMRPDDRWLVTLPLFHANAQFYSLMSALVSGASIAVMQRFSATQWGKQAQVHGATLGSLFAAPIRMILAHPPGTADGANALRATLFAQNLTPTQLIEFERRFDCPLVQLYGMTETVAPPLMNPIYRRRDNMTVGWPTTAARVRLVDDEGHDVTAPGAVGELLVGGEPGVSLMAGYLNDPDATAAALQNGWLRTGDMMRLADNGAYAFEDRSKDMIKRSGENVAAAEVERVLNTHPAVFESAAIGVPDPIRDEAIAMFVVLNTESTCTADELIAFCEQHLARFKVPSSIKFVEALPRTAVGKVQKHVLRNRLRDEPQAQASIH